MGSLSARYAESVLAVVDPSPFRRIVDVGGSHGALLLGLLEAAVDATGVLFDLPDTIEGAREHVNRSPRAARVDLVGGDFLREVPPTTMRRRPGPDGPGADGTGHIVPGASGCRLCPTNPAWSPLGSR